MAYISVLTDKKNALVKEISLDGTTGELLKTATGHIVDGWIESFDVNAKQLISVITGLTKNQCLCLGVPNDGELQEKRPITCLKLSKGGLTRTKDSLAFHPSSSWLLLDFDDCQKTRMTPELAISTLSKIDSQLLTCSMVVVPSSSSYIYNTSTEQFIVEEGNFHIFVEVEGDRDPGEYGNILFERLLLNGLGVPYVHKSGAVTVKSLFDLSTLSFEREIFSASPVCKEPLVSKRLEHVAYQEGHRLDSDVLKPLSTEEKLKLRLMYKQMREDLHEKSMKVRKEYYKEQAKKKAAQKGTHYLKELPDVLETPILYDKQGRPVLELLSSENIMNEDGEWFLVRDLLLNPVEELKLPDPIEPFKRGDEKRGIPGKGIATVLGNMIYSHHHCGVIHLLRWDPADFLELLIDGNLEDKKFAWRAVSTGMQEFSASTTESDLSEIADVVKAQLGTFKDMKVGKEKKHILNKLHAGSIPENAEIDKILEMNCKYGVVNMAGKTVIVSERWNSAAKEFEVEFALPASMDTFTKNIPMRIPGKFEPVSLYKYWEQHVERRTYNGVKFEPNAHTFREPGVHRPLPDEDEYNFFQGYLYSPQKAKSCDKILNHIKEVWCSSIEEEYNYVIGWLAHLFQHPEQLSKTAIILQSVPGAGKGIIIENCIVKVMGTHGMSTSNTDDLVGRFNLHLGWNIFFFANEISYTAQNSVKSLLKTLVETDTRSIEAKNVNKVKAKNYSSIIFASNGDWVLNIESDDRRYVYLTVSSHRVGDIQYFTDLAKQIEDGGKDAFVKYLLNYDLSKYQPTVIPNRKQKQRMADYLRSAHPSVKFIWSLYDTDYGVAHFANDPSYKALKEWQDSGDKCLTIGKAQLFSLYRDYCEYYRIERKFDDPTALEMQLEVGGILKRQGDPREKNFIMDRKIKDGKEVYVICSVKDGKERRIV